MAIRKLQGQREIAEGSYFEFDTDADVLGEGGMGRVYLGRKIDRNGGVKTVAIKAMFEGLPDQVIERARREASIQLKNDSLVEMYGFIETDDTNSLGEHIVHYHVISEYLDGISLADLIEGKLEDRHGKVHSKIEKIYKEYTADKEAKATEIIKSVLSGIMALHDVGYIHRDIDPTNIMVTVDGKFKLIDFGVAKQLVRLNTSDKGLTSSGQFLGKSGYAAPELVLGDVRNQSWATDVYAIGILYYQLVTGHLPFDGTSYDMMEAQLHNKLPLKHVNSIQIRNVIAKATEKKIGDRYSTASQFRAAVDSFVFPEPWHVNRWKVLLVVVIILLVGGIGAYWLIPEPEVQPTFEELYDQYLIKLDSSDPLEALDGFNEMKSLAEEGYVPAMFQVAYTYVWAPSDSTSVNRKLVLGLKTDGKYGLLKENSKNEEAITWLKRIIEKTDSTEYQSMAWLAQYYINGKVINEDIDVAVSLLLKSREVAMQENDLEFVEKINKVLVRVKEIKK